MSGSLGTIIILLLLVFQYKRILGFLNLTKVRMRASEGRPVLRTRIPEHTRHLLETAHEALAALGFELIGAQAFETLNTCDPRSHTYTDFQWHPERAVLAMAEPAPGLSGQATQVQFVTMFGDGTSLMTVNRHQWEMMPMPGNITVLDALADDLPTQWTFHLQALAADKRSRSVVTDKLRVLNRLDDVLTPRTMENLVGIGWAREVSPGIYRLTARGAWRYSGLSRRRTKAAGAALSRPYRHNPQPSIEAVRIHEVQGAAANIELGAQPLPSWIKVALFAGTLLLSVLVLGGAFKPMALAALFVVMFVHELGHFTAMWAFGYKNLSMFFLPFFGAAASGHKPHAPAWQESLVLLAGPVPGILLALAATQIPSDALPLWGAQFVRWFVLFALFINVFNLLPVGILDGGRLFQLAVLGRFPYLRAAFAGLGALIGLAYGLYSGSRGLAIAMGITLINMPVQFKAARVTAAIRKQAKAAGQRKLGKDEVIHALGREFAHPHFGATSASGWTQRLGITQLAYPRLLQGVPALGTSIMAMALQGTAFFVPIVLVVLMLQQGEQVPLMHTSVAEQRVLDQQAASTPAAIAEKAARKKFMMRYAAEHDPVAKWEMLDQNETADDEDDGDDSPPPGAATPVALDETWVERQRQALLPQLPAGHPGRLRRILDTTSGPQDTDKVLDVVNQLTAGDPQAAAKLDRQRFALLMDAYDRLATTAPPAVLAAQQPMLDALWTELDVPGAPNADAKARLADTRARVAFVSGDTATAATWMDRHVAAAGKDDRYAALEQGWFLLDIGRADAAQALAVHAMRDARKGRVPRDDWQALAGWVEMSRGHARHADAYFQAVLKARAARAQRALSAMPWWMRWLNKATHGLTPGALQVNAATLDHLAALNTYDPAQGAHLIADLRKGIKAAPGNVTLLYIRSTFDGWGKARAAAHDKLRKVIYAGIAPVQKKPAGALAPAAAI